MSNTSSAFGKFVVWLMVVILIIAIAAIALFFVLRGQGMTFYVSYNGVRCLGGSTGDSIELLNGITNNFFVKGLTGNDVNYTVKVTSNAANNFGFVCNGEPYMFFGTDDEYNDYTDVFGVEKHTNSFSLTLPDGFTVEQAIETKYGGDIELQSELADDLCYFIITVTEGTSSVDLWFTFTDLTITFNPPNIVFDGNDFPE